MALPVPGRVGRGSPPVGAAGARGAGGAGGEGGAEGGLEGGELGAREAEVGGDHVHLGGGMGANLMRAQAGHDLRYAGVVHARGLFVGRVECCVLACVVNW